MFLGELRTKGRSNRVKVMVMISNRVKCAEGPFSRDTGHLFSSYYNVSAVVIIDSHKLTTETLHLKKKVLKLKYLLDLYIPSCNCLLILPYFTDKIHRDRLKSCITNVGANQGRSMCTAELLQSLVSRTRWI